MPLYDRCNKVINALFDSHGADTTQDGNASVFYEFQGKCLVRIVCRVHMR